MAFHYHYNNHSYHFYLDDFSGNKIRVVTDTGKTVYIKIIEKPGFSVKYYKNYIGADGAARGLFAFFADCVKNNFMTAWVNIAIDRYVEAA